MSTGHNLSLKIHSSAHELQYSSVPPLTSNISCRQNYSRRGVRSILLCPPGALTSPWTQKKTVWSLAKPMNMTRGECVRGGGGERTEGRWRGCCSLHHRQDKWRIDRRHSKSLPHSFSFQLQQPGSGSADAHVKKQINDTVCWPLPQQDLHRDHSRNKTHRPHNQESKWTME